MNLLLSSTTNASYAGLMLAYRQRRWPNIKPALHQCLFYNWDGS